MQLALFTYFIRINHRNTYKVYIFRERQFKLFKFNLPERQSNNPQAVGPITTPVEFYLIYVLYTEPREFHVDIPYGLMYNIHVQQVYVYNNLYIGNSIIHVYVLGVYNYKYMPTRGAAHEIIDRHALRSCFELNCT